MQATTQLDLFDDYAKYLRRLKKDRTLAKTNHRLAILKARKQLLPRKASYFASLETWGD